jgi:peptide/nickel transport system ATP-binding protein
MDGLTVALPEGGDRAFAIEDVTLEIQRGEIVCVVGESGSGKSVAASALMGLLPRGLSIARGAAWFAGEDVAAMSRARLRDLRGREVSMIFQEPLSALNPLMKIGAQIEELFEAHGVFRGAQGRARILDLFAYVDLPDPRRLVDAYPHQLSGGQRQRVVIAMALALEPRLILADEPTTALDVTTQAQVLALLRRIREEKGASILFVTHDFGVVADFADRVIVMQSGRIVEEGPVERILADPQRDYTRKLVAAVPRLTPARLPPPEPETVLAVDGVTKTYSGRGVRAVDHVTLSVRRGETLGVIGESGSGKSSLGRMIVRLIEPDAGHVLFRGTDMTALARRDFREARKALQMIFQDPLSSLNPRKRVRTILTDGPAAHGVARADAEKRAADLLSVVGLNASALDRFPHEFSGGQRQRIGIARALMLDPEVIVADEPVSALDVSVQAQVLDLLNDLQSRMKLALVFITHDLRVAAQLCHSVAVMQRGVVVEQGPTAEVFANPRHDYTKRLLAAIPGRRLEDLPVREPA